jgi:hypothetical protein
MNTKVRLPADLAYIANIHDHSHVDLVVVNTIKVALIMLLMAHIFARKDMKVIFGGGRRYTSVSTMNF